MQTFRERLEHGLEVLFLFVLLFALVLFGAPEEADDTAHSPTRPHDAITD